MTHAVEGEKEVIILTMSHLKILINDEWDSFVFFQKESHDHHAEASFNDFSISL